MAEDGEEPTLGDVLDRLEALEERVERLEAHRAEGPDAGAPEAASASEAEPAEAPGAGPGEGADEATRFRVVEDEPGTPPAEAGAGEPAAEPAPGAGGGGEAQSLEDRIGADLLGKTGVLVLTLGLAFFVLWAIESGLVGLRTRIVLGVLGGLGVVGLGHRLRDHPDYGNLAQVGAGGGFALAYFSTYAAYHFETYRPLFGLSLAADTVFLGAISAGVAAYGARVRSSSFLVEALALGFVTGFLSTELTVLSLAYGAFIALAVAGASVRVGAPRLAAASMVAAYVHLLFTSTGVGDAATVLGFAALDGALFAGFAVLVPRDPVLESATDVSGRAQLLLANAAGLLAVGTFVAEGQGVLDGGRWPVLVGAAHGGLALVLREVRPALQVPAALAALAGVTLAVPLALDGAAVLLAWAALYALVATASRFTDSARTRHAVHVLGFLLAVATATEQGPNLAPGAERVTTLATVAAAYGLTYVVLALEEDADPVDPPGITPRLVHLAAGVAVLGALLAAELSGLAVTLSLALLAVALVAAGFASGWSEPRWMGLATFGAALLKAFIYDVWQLDLALRVAAFVGLGLALVGAAVAYARYGAGDAPG